MKKLALPSAYQDFSFRCLCLLLANFRCRRSSWRHRQGWQESRYFAARARACTCPIKRFCFQTYVILSCSVDEGVLCLDKLLPVSKDVWLLSEGVKDFANINPSALVCVCLG